MVHNYGRVGWLAVLGVLTFGGVSVAQTEDQTGGVSDKPQGTKPSQEVKPADKTEEEGAAEPKDWTVKFGTDYYAGRSNLPGFRRYSDGFWAAGSGLAYPSSVYVRSAKGESKEAKFAWGVGDLYVGSGKLFNQPLEAWYKTPLGKSNVTVGKFWVPFALQEWEYETKWGVQLDREVGPYSLIAAVNYDGTVHDPNGYFRASRNFGKNLNVALSLGTGRGLTYGTVQNRGIGLDATFSTGGWQFVTENVIFTRRRSEQFNFNFAKLSYEKLGKFKPFIAKYTWNDRAGVFGSFHSSVAGAGYQLTPELAIEGGIADTPGRTVNYLQLHITAER